MYAQVEAMKRDELRGGACWINALGTLLPPLAFHIPADTFALLNQSLKAPSPLGKPVSIFQMHTESSLFLIPLPPLQTCQLLCSSFLTSHLLRIAGPFSSFQSQFRCSLSRETLPNCSDPWPLLCLHPDTPSSPSSFLWKLPPNLWGFLFLAYFLGQSILPRPSKGYSTQLSGLGSSPSLLIDLWLQFLFGSGPGTVWTTLHTSTYFS